MIYDFLVFGENVGKAIKIEGCGGVSEAASAAACQIEHETGDCVSAAVFIPGNKSFEELAAISFDDLIKPGNVVQIFEFDE